MFAAYKFLIPLVVWCFEIIGLLMVIAEDNAERQDYMTLKTHFAVDKFQRSIRKQVNELLGITEMQVCKV